MEIICNASTFDGDFMVISLKVGKNVNISLGIPLEKQYLAK